MITLIGSDLDQTLIYSRAAIDRYGDGGRSLVAVEQYRGADASWMTVEAAQSLRRLPSVGAVLVPVTTRTPEQWHRISLPGERPEHVIVANGGILLVDGLPDPDWSALVRSRLASVAPLLEVLTHAELECRPGWTVSVREACGLFCYAVVDRTRLPAQFLSDTTAWARARGWRVSLQGRKLYWVPEPLTKSAALAEVARRMRASRVLAAGDSLLDEDLLLSADAGLLARHGELAASGWSAPGVGVTDADGIVAGEQIAQWCLHEPAQATRQ